MSKRVVKTGDLIIISGFSGSYNVNFRSGMWGDHTGKKFMYVILARANDYDDDYIVLSHKGKIERLTSVSCADNLEVL